MLQALIKKELLALSRDPHGMAALFLMPIMFIIIMSLALKNVYTPPIDALHYAVQRLDEGRFTEQLLKTWSKEHGAARVLPEHWQEALQSGKLDYVLVVEKGFSEEVTKAQLPSEAYIRLLTKAEIDSSALNANKAALMIIVSQLREQVFLQAAQMNLTLSHPSPEKSTLPAVQIDRFIQAKRLSSGIRPTAVQQNVPAWLMFGMFFVVTSIANLFIQERESGALTRLASLGVPVSVMLLSKALPYFIVNAAQAVLMLAVGVWVMPLLGGDALSLQGIDWFALVLVLSCISAAAIGLALALASLSRTHAQAAAVGPALNVLMAATGGVMVPTFVMPEVMVHLSAYSPMNWGLNGMLAVLLNGQGYVSVIPYAAKLLGFALFMFALAMLMFKRRIH